MKTILILSRGTLISASEARGMGTGHICSSQDKEVENDKNPKYDNQTDHYRRFQSPS